MGARFHNGRFTDIAREVVLRVVSVYAKTGSHIGWGDLLVATS